MKDNTRSAFILRNIATVGPDAAERMSSDGLRSSFLVDGLFCAGQLRLVQAEMDRFILGGVVPLEPIPLPLLPGGHGETLLVHREMGIINLGAPGLVRVAKKTYRLDEQDCLYIGKEESDIWFEKEEARSPSFYFVSCPAHRKYPTVITRKADAKIIPLGNKLNASERTICQYIHPAGLQSSQLMMGITQLEEGSIWNTMPAHTHDRRSEVYLYNGLKDGNFVVHLMGKPGQSRSLIVRNQEAVLSPSWSIHTGAGTSNYQFIWAMAGENQDFNDFDLLPLSAIS